MHESVDPCDLPDSQTPMVHRLIEDDEPLLVLPHSVVYTPYRGHWTQWTTASRVLTFLKGQ